MANEHILVVDDEEDILELVEYNLVKNGYRVTSVINGEDALSAARTQKPDVIVLDLMLPGIDGFEVCKILKSDADLSHVPIIMLTAKGEDADQVTGLELGADDYVTKPFSPRVLTARIRTALRRRSQKPASEEETINIGDINISPGRHQVAVQDEPVDLTHTEFRLLYFLAKRPGWVFSRDQIIDEVHGSDYAVTDRSVDVLVSGLRKKLGPSGNLIETVRGVGYRLKE
jgi:two-component system phosphate regulon response regulator PhoB